MLTLLFLLPQLAQHHLVRKLHTNKFGHLHSRKRMDNGAVALTVMHNKYIKQNIETVAVKIPRKFCYQLLQPIENKRSWIIMFRIAQLNKYNMGYPLIY